MSKATATGFALSSGLDPAGPASGTANLHAASRAGAQRGEDVRVLPVHLARSPRESLVGYGG